ncbi:MAG: hypothetical protein P8M34_05175 [Saprospiraceae bacterium]|nr:hypothetical protein [Saprospiraceae bacterium]
MDEKKQNPGREIKTQDSIKGLNRRKALKNILAGSTPLFVGFPLSLKAWGQPSGYSSPLSMTSSFDKTLGRQELGASASEKSFIYSTAPSANILFTTAPTTAPTNAPTFAPTNAPTNAPTMAPTQFVPSPTMAPTSCDFLTLAPTSAPTSATTAPPP